MNKRYIQFSYKSEPLVVEEKGISFRKLIIFLIAIILVMITSKNRVDKDIIIALISSLLK
ncbi:hypothetical protein [Clostridium sp. ZBS18]|uniref:hypothetical protein n=1 Tax=Clostridium sp. ZBS18 TaxID=2949967 RepID=UPI00207983F5|nr:hypothetical protein [Clostridium sp. ZBS18]